MKRINIRKRIASLVFPIMAVLLAAFLLLLSFPAPSSSEEIYKFERMWPTLQQPWYFSEFKLAVDKNDYVYIFNEKTKEIEKFSADGNFIHKWNTPVSGDGQISNTDLMMFTVDKEGFVYILDNQEGRIRKFTSDGQFVRHWGMTQCQFVPGYDNQGDIIADDQGYIYASDRCTMSITKFTSDGQLIATWGGVGNNDGQFQELKAITIDKGLLYAGDRTNNSISIFTLDGQFVRKWSSTGIGNDNLLKLFSMKVDKNGFLYVNADFGKILKYTVDGVFIEAWYKDISREIAVDSNGYIYLNDYYSILKLAGNGNIIARWESRGAENGKFNEPVGIAVDDSGYVYVAEEGNNRVQKFTSDGQYVTKWEAGIVMAIATDKKDFVYTADGIGGYIKKFSLDGQFVKKWEVPGAYANGYVYFANPSKISIDNDGYVYIWLPLQNQWPRITTFKFTADGELVTSWESSGHPMYQQSLFNPLDCFGNYYLVDYDNFIKKYSNSGQLLATFGGTGVVPGKFIGVYDLSIASNGMIYVVDTANNRVQVFRQVTTSSRNKAIIVAGGGPYSGNDLWDATQMSANFAYRTLTYQGFTKESIHYLTSANIDLDDNGVLDDVAGDATNANLQNAITTWALEAEDVIVYLVDHGGTDSFRMSGNETLSAVQLSSWLNTLQNSITGKVIVIYDACESGSFVDDLKPPLGKQRIVISSASPGESAYFVTQGSVSFSNYFWTHIFNGVNIKDAFELTRSAMGYTTAYQHPLLDANGNGTANEAEDLTLVQNAYIGSGTVIFGSAPVIGSVSADPIINNPSSALLYADNVTDADGIARVWAVIRPPDYNQGGSDNPVQDLPSIDLMPVGNDRYEATYNAFNISGTYQIAIYARDRIGNTSIPKITTVSVTNPLRRKAIIVAGGSQADTLWPAIERGAKLAYDALRFQGYKDDDIYFMSPVAFSSGYDVTSTLSNLQYAVMNWASDNTQDVALYMIGRGNSGVFSISASETLNAAELKTWLDTLQGIIPGAVTVVYDAPLSGSFLPLLKNPPSGKTRILLTSTGAAAPVYFLSDGDISFSRFFWDSVLNGTDLRGAYINAKRAMGFLAPGQTPLLDDNGDGVYTKSDGIIAMNHVLGFGITLAADNPLIGSVSSPQTLTGETSTTIWAKDVTTTGEIASVWAILTPPGGTPFSLSVPITEAQFVQLFYNQTNDRYEGAYDGILTSGQYDIAIYAIDQDRNVSVPSATTVTQTIVVPDAYEDDNTIEKASVIILNDENPQRHNFHAAGDVDWVKFYAVQGQIYEMKAGNLGPHADVVLELYKTGEMTTNLIAGLGDIGRSGENELVSWKAPETGIYYLKVRQFEPGIFGEGTYYDLKIYRPAATDIGTITGIISSDLGQALIASATIQAALGSALSADGSFVLKVEAGTVNLSVDAEGYNSVILQDVVVEAGQETMVNVSMALAIAGDVDNDLSVDMADAILVLKAVSGIPATIHKDADVNGDGRIGLAEVLYILQKIAGTRVQ